MGKSSGEEMITEYTTTRRLSLTIGGGLTQSEAPGSYYSGTYGRQLVLDPTFVLDLE